MSLLVKLYKYTFVNNENLITSHIKFIFIHNTYIHIDNTFQILITFVKILTMFEVLIIFSQINYSEIK